MGCGASSSKKRVKRYNSSIKKRETDNDIKQMLVSPGYELRIYDYNFVIKTENNILEPYTIMGTLGAGGFAHVREAKYRGVAEHQFAVKSMRKILDGVDMRQCIINELDILNSLDHPNIANFNECYEDDTFIHAVLEFSPGKCLAEYLEGRSERMPIDETLKIFYQIFNTASYLRKNSIIHRDYKPPNIMIYETGENTKLGYQIQLLDFGLARRKKVIGQEIFGSPHYIAPETLECNVSYPADVWAIGIMLYYAIALRFPFESEDQAELFRSIKEDELKFEPESAWEGVPDDVRDLISKMLVKEPYKRINVEIIPKHAAFSMIHDIEREISLTNKEKVKLNRYFRLTPLQRKFMKYSSKFIPPKEKTSYCEKFMLLDTECDGYIEFYTSDEYSDKDSSRSESVEDTSNNSSPPTPTVRKVTYSDFLAALRDPKKLCGEMNTEMIFHTLNPSYKTDKVLKNEMRAALFFGNESEEEIEGFDAIKGVERSGRVIIKKKWVDDFLNDIKNVMLKKK